MIVCPNCNQKFEIVAHISYFGPEYCPYCGSEINYEELGEIDEMEV